MAKSIKVETLEGRPMLIMKSAMQVSGNTVQRYRTPPNSKLVDAATQFVFDHKQQAQVIPDMNRRALVEATNASSKGQGRKSYQSANKGGRTAALGPLAEADLSGSPDESGFQFKYFNR
jgi:hypothetical protein